MSFEALFFRQLQQVTTLIHATDNIEQIMLDASGDICRLFNADRLTLYAVNDDQIFMLSKDIAKQIEEKMTYPGQIKITVIRETRAVSYAK